MAYFGLYDHKCNQVKAVVKETKEAAPGIDIDFDL